jgi:pantoate ligase/cytidylate kinase
MGALHAGHLSLIQRCRQECDYTVVSIFVNPLQFGPDEDLEDYPRTLLEDCNLCEQAGVDLVFTPSVAELLPNIGSTQTQVIPPKDLLLHLCAPFRPGHFEGVATIVLQLFNIVRPHRAYFGQKDAQQVQVIRRVVQDLHYPIQITVCPIVRETDGLALSSRNRYLTPTERIEATGIYVSLSAGKARFEQGDKSAVGICQAVRDSLAQFPLLQVQYLELVDPETLQPLDDLENSGLLAIAAYIGKTRLIDNVMLHTQDTANSSLTEITPTQSSTPPLLPLIAIDGPAGAGKSTVARRVAAELNLLYLDTGAMYRAITWLALHQGIPLNDEKLLCELVKKTKMTLDTSARSIQTRIWVNGQEVTDEIRTKQVTERVSQVSALAGVREAMVTLQRSIGKQGGIVLEGRDIGTTVFPEAELKIFLTASLNKRAERRQKELQNKGQDIDLGELLRQIEARDRYDSERAIAPLRQAPDAIVIETDHLSQAEVQAEIVRCYYQLKNN